MGSPDVQIGDVVYARLAGQYGGVAFRGMVTIVDRDEAWLLGVKGAQMRCQTDGVVVLPVTAYTREEADLVAQRAPSSRACVALQRLQHGIIS